MSKLSELIAPPFYGLHDDIRQNGHTHYWIKGGRGSTKSSFVSVEIILGMMKDRPANAIVYRKVKDTLKTSVYAQLLWVIDMLGVSHLWKRGESPLRLVYIPTGQQVMFRGLDRANKSKSIKPPHGYFRYIWFEELDEFAGSREIRSVLQSVERGGPVFNCFYTYNPPKSQRNWVNEAALEEQENRITHHSDYRGVPPEWLGKEFIVEAEHIRETKPEIYEHEYLGKVTGTGTEVFTNLIRRRITDQEIKRFDELNRGLDFGYASDPLHYTVNYYDSTRRRLYIFFELHLLKTSNAELGKKIVEEMEEHGRRFVCCDNEDPKSIDDLYYLGIPAYGAKKGPGSVNWGMRFLAEEVEEIIIDPVRCPNTFREFHGYELDTDGNGNAIPKYPDRDNHSIDAVRYSLEDRIRDRYARERRKEG